MGHVTQLFMDLDLERKGCVYSPEHLWGGVRGMLVKFLEYISTRVLAMPEIILIPKYRRKTVESTGSRGCKNT